MKKGIKLPFRISEFDEDSPIAIQRNFSEIEYYLNVLKGGVGALEEQLSLVSIAPGASDGDMPLPDEEDVTDVHPTLSLVEHILPGEGQMGSLDLDVKTSDTGAINEVWVMRVINRQCNVEIYNSSNLEAPARTFTVTPHNAGADIVDVSITFAGNYNVYGIFISNAAPNMFWVERTDTEDRIYGVEWDGMDTMPAPTFFGSAQLGLRGTGAGTVITV